MAGQHMNHREKDARIDELLIAETRYVERIDRLLARVRQLEDMIMNVAIIANNWMLWPPREPLVDPKDMRGLMMPSLHTWGDGDGKP